MVLISKLLLLSCFSRVRLCATPQTAAHQAPCPWDSPGKNPGVGCHFLLQCMKVKSESEFAQSCPTLSDLMDCSPPGSSVHGIFQARVLEWLPKFLSSPYSHCMLVGNWTVLWSTFFQQNLTMKNKRQPNVFSHSFGYLLTYVCVYIYISFQILFPYRLLPKMEYCFLCYTVGPCWLSILYIVVCIF